MGPKPQGKKSQASKLQFRKSAVYIYHNNPVVYGSAQFAHNLAIVTTFKSIKTPSVDESILFGSHQMKLRLL